MTIPSRLSDLAGASYNPRTISEEAAAGLRCSLATFGDLSGLVWNQRSEQLVCGHQRKDALAAEFGDLVLVDGAFVTAAGLRFPVRVVDWDRATEIAANLAANSSQLSGEWSSPEAVAALGAEVEAALPEAWRGLRLDDLLAEIQGAGGAPAPGPPPEDDAPPVAEGPPDSMQGEVYQLGPHRLMCGDCRDFGAWQKLLTEGERVNLVFTSPPYASQRKYDESSGFKPIPPDEYGDWWQDVQGNVRAWLAEDGSFFVNIKEHCEDGQRHLYVKKLVIRMVEGWAWRWVEEYSWLRQSLPGDPNSMHRFKNAWESVFAFCVGEFKFRPEAVMHKSQHAFKYADQVAAGMDISASSQGKGNNAQSPVGQGEGMAYPSNVLDIMQGANVVGHSAAFPSGLPDFFVRAYTDPGDLVLDTFLGSGTTLIAAAQNGRRAAGFELSPKYCDIIRRRWFRWATEHKQDPGPGALE